MQIRFDVSSDNERFQQSFRRFGLIWLVVLTIFTIVIVSINLSEKPFYLYDWRGAAIIGLSLAVIVIYSFITIRKYNDWPPSIAYALSVWLSTYIVIILLALVEPGFAWDFFILIGISFSLFDSRRLLVAVSVLFVTILAFQGLLRWPLGGDDIASILGLGIFCYSIAATGMMTQRLIGERYERNQLLHELSQANTELEEAHRQLAESAIQEQELAVLRERTRLAREMHDTLGHALVLISVKLEAAQRLRERDPQRCDRELESTKEIVRECMKELRASIANLRSPALEHEPASHAISRYAHDMAHREGLRVTYDLHPDIEGLPEQVEETLWKVGQEALTNIEKHAQASNVVLHISRQDDCVRMRIEDDGIGLPPELCHTRSFSASEMHADGNVICSSPEGHYGLSDMFERVERMGGRIYLRSGGFAGQNEPKIQGTIVEVELPLVAAPL